MKVNENFKKITFIIFSLVVLPVFSAENSTIQSQGKKCSAIEASVARLTCYDKMFLFDTNSSQASSTTKLTQRKSLPIIEPTVAANKSIASTQNNVTSQNNSERANNAGKKYLSGDSGKECAIHLSLVKMKKNKYNNNVFYFENGQIWQQLEPSYIARPKQFPITARLTSGALNSYNLRLGNKAKKIKVKRVK